MTDRTELGQYATTTSSTIPVQPPPLSEEECLKIGGHCYEMANYVLTSNPLIYVRVCKHCGKKQHGQSQENIRWSNVD